MTNDAEDLGPLLSSEGPSLNDSFGAIRKPPVKEKPRRIVFVALAAMVLVQMCYSGLYVFSRKVLSEIDPFVFATIRVSLATLIMLPLSRGVDRVQVRLKLIPVLALLGVSGVAINQTLVAVALTKTSATNTGVLQPTIPVLTTLFSVLVKQEDPHPLKFLGILVSVAGVLVMLRVDQLHIENSDSLGMILVLIACTSISVTFVIQKKVLEHLPALTITAFSFLFGGIIITGIAIPHLMKFKPAETPALAWGGIIYAALVPTALTYSLQTWAITYLDPALVACFIVLQPLFTALLGWLVLGELITVWTLAGGSGAIFGLLLVVYSKILSKRKMERLEAINRAKICPPDTPQDPRLPLTDV